MQKQKCFQLSKTNVRSEQFSLYPPLQIFEVCAQFVRQTQRHLYFFCPLSFMKPIIKAKIAITNKAKLAKRNTVALSAYPKINDQMLKSIMKIPVSIPLITGISFLLGIDQISPDTLRLIDNNYNDPHQLSRLQTRNNTMYRTSRNRTLSGSCLVMLLQQFPQSIYSTFSAIWIMVSISRMLCSLK